MAHPAAPALAITEAERAALAAITLAPMT